jgi:hypothetical protein
MKLEAKYTAVPVTKAKISDAYLGVFFFFLNIVRKPKVVRQYSYKTY